MPAKAGIHDLPSNTHSSGPPCDGCVEAGLIGWPDAARFLLGDEFIKAPGA